MVSAGEVALGIEPLLFPKPRSWASEMLVAISFLSQNVGSKSMVKKDWLW